MTKSSLVKIGVPAEQAHGMRRLRRIRQIIDQRDAAVARLDAATNERIREAMNADDSQASETSDAEEPVAATA
jgi:hypothetical protein